MTAPTVVQALIEVMRAVQSIGKDSENLTQHFKFRGIDATMAAVGPALREHGVIVVPVGEDMIRETYETKGKTVMRNVVLRVRFVFHGPTGDTIEAVAYGEAADAGDKAVSKAHSVAFRTVLLQTLCIPTGDPEPDASSHERSSRSYEDSAYGQPSEARAARADRNNPSVVRGQIANLGKAKQMTPDEIAADFTDWSQGELIGVADPKLLTEYLDYLSGRAVPA